MDTKKQLVRQKDLAYQSHVFLHFFVLIPLILPWSNATLTSCQKINTADTLNITEKDNGKSISILSGQIIKITLGSQLGTGYSWHHYNHDAKLELIRQLSTEGGDLAGTKENSIFYFKAVSPGKAVIKLHYLRPFDKDKPPEKIFHVNITVKKE